MKTYQLSKNSNLERPKNVNKQDYSAAPYGEIYTYAPLDNPVTYYHFKNSTEYSSQEYRCLSSLKNIINYYGAYDDMFSYDNFYNKPATIYAFSSAHYGSGIQKGTVELNIYISGSIISTASDRLENGVLYEKDTDEKIGIVLYKEGFILINNTAELTTDNVQYSSSYGEFVDKPKWIHAFLSSSYGMYCDKSYGIKSDVSTNITFIYANKYELNHSNNPTYIQADSYLVSSGPYHFTESEEIKIKNTIASPFNSGSSEFEKQTFITKIGLYNENKDLIAVASLANPVRKTENREFVFKLKLDI